MDRITKPTTLRLNCKLLIKTADELWWFLDNRPFLCGVGVERYFGVVPVEGSELDLEVSPEPNGGKLVALTNGLIDEYWNIPGLTEDDNNMSSLLGDYIRDNVRVNGTQELYVKFAPVAQTANQ